MTTASNPKAVRQSCAGFATHRLGAGLTLTVAVAVALASLTSLPALAQTVAPPGTTPPAASAHPPAHRHGPARTSPANTASTVTADTADRPVLPRLIAIATPEDDDAIPRFALFAARDIEQLGLQFPAQNGDVPTDTEVVITMSLRDSASIRMRDFSRQHMNEPMTLIVDGVEMLTATIRSELGGKFQLQMPKEKARLLFQRVLAKAGPAT